MGEKWGPVLISVCFPLITSEAGHFFTLAICLSFAGYLHISSCIFIWGYLSLFYWTHDPSGYRPTLIYYTGTQVYCLLCMGQVSPPSLWLLLFLVCEFLCHLKVWYTQLYLSFLLFHFVLHVFCCSLYFYGFDFIVGSLNHMKHLYI